MMNLIPQTSDMFSFEWLKYYVNQYGQENVSIFQDANEILYIKVVENENRSSSV